MVKYLNIQERLKALGLSTAVIRKHKILSESTLTRLRNNGNITTDQLDIICNLLHCPISEVMEIEFLEDEEEIVAEEEEN